MRSRDSDGGVELRGEKGRTKKTHPDVQVDSGAIIQKISKTAERRFLSRCGQRSQTQILQSEASPRHK